MRRCQVGSSVVGTLHRRSTQVDVGGMSRRENKRLGVVACACNKATWGPGGGSRCRWESRPALVHVDWASMLGAAPIWGPCWRAVVFRSSKKRRTGPNGKLSSQKPPRGAVAG